jgi:molybdopterin converting factor small subunit
VGIKVHIHKTHRQFTDGQEIVEVEGRNVGECLKQVVQKYPTMKESLFDKKGRLLNVIEVYVNMESAYPEELAKKVKGGDEIHITMMLAGG